MYREPSFEEEANALVRSRSKLEAPDLTSGGRLFFTADHHFYHGNILKRCPERGRLFKTVDEMNAAFIENHNRTVSRDDTVIIVGDYFWRGRGGNPGCENSPAGSLREMKYITGKLNGRKYLIRGNHDKFTDEEYIEAGFAGCGQYAVLNGGEGPVTILHSPKDIIALWYAFMRTPGYFSEADSGYETCFEDILTIPGRYLCGHVHQLWRRLGPFVNVGLDVWSMAPVSFEAAMAAFDEQSRVYGK